MTTRSFLTIVLLVLVAAADPVVGFGRRGLAFGMRTVQTVSVVHPPTAAATGEEVTPGDAEAAAAASNGSRDEKMALRVASEQADTFLSVDGGCFDFF